MARLDSKLGVSVAAAVLLAGLPLQAHAAVKKAAKKPVKKVAAKGKAAPAPASRVPAALLKEATGLTVAPGAIALDGPRSEQHLVVTLYTKDGSTYDVTDKVAFSLANPKLARISGTLLLPAQDGATKLVAKAGTLASVAVDVTVKNSHAAAPVEFVNDIMPILTKGGCNATACHGSPVGKGGFKLSLFGYEPDADYTAIAKDGKRIDSQHPEKSLILTKPIMGVPHAGGMRFKPDSAEAKTLMTWLKDGAPGIGEFEARVRRVEVIPPEPWMPSPNAKQHLAVVAEMSDGSERDVTDKALFSSNDDAIADVSEEGLITSKRAGETAVMVRYMGQVAISRVAILPPWKLDSYPRIPHNNYIDDLVQAKLQRLRVVPSDLCTDEEFIRRATLDTCGIIPTPEEVRAFMSDTSVSKRERLVDQLLARPEHVDLWTVKWNDILRNNPRLTRVGAESYAHWIHDQLASNRPYDQFVHDLLTATGRNTEMPLDVNNLPARLKERPNIERLVARLNAEPANPAANYFVVQKDPLDVTSATSQIFLGVRIECSRCHNHPFEKWTQTDYYSFASFFNGFRAQGGNQTPTLVEVNPRSPVLRHPKTNEPVEPKVLDGTEVKLQGVADKRTVVADWMTSANNPWFAKALVNRLWGHYFGRGIVEPIDDFRVTNPASNPELLDALAKDFVEHKFDLKHMHRTILLSRTYQQSSRPNQYNRQDTNNFARFYPKRMMAEELYDSISEATGIFAGGGGRLAARGGKGKQGKQAQQAQPYAMGRGQQTGTRIMQNPTLVPGNNGGNPLQTFLNAFGKPRREVVCECERSSDGNMGQALVLINGTEVNTKISAPAGRVQQLVRMNAPDPALVEELYLSALSRRPTVAEMNEAIGLIRSGRSRSEGAEDLMWSLLNSREFLFIH